MNHNKAFGRALRQLRREYGITQEGLGFLCGLDRTYISMLELAQSSPTLNTLIAISTACNITLVELATRIEAAMLQEPPNDPA